MRGRSPVLGSPWSSEGDRQGSSQALYRVLWERRVERAARRGQSPASWSRPFSLPGGTLLSVTWSLKGANGTEWGLVRDHGEIVKLD